MKTFMKWAGNKSSIVEKIAPCLVGETLIEPFAGSCAVSLNTNFKKYICNDINADMINMYQLIQKNPTEFIKSSQDFFLNGNEETCIDRILISCRSALPNQVAIRIYFLNDPLKFVRLSFKIPTI